jgi:hypothetical protein
MEYHCSVCGAGAFYDGRCGDGPILLCGCDQGQYVDEGSRGGYHVNDTGARSTSDGPITTKMRKFLKVVSAVKEADGMGLVRLMDLQDEK